MHMCRFIGTIQPNLSQVYEVKPQARKKINISLETHDSLSPHYCPSHLSRCDCSLHLRLGSHMWLVKVVMEPRRGAVS